MRYIPPFSDAATDRFDIEKQSWPLIFRYGIIIFHFPPPEVAGTVGTIYNVSLQLLAGGDIPIATAIQVGVTGGDADVYKGRLAGFR